MVKIMRTLYSKDFELFNYSSDLRDIPFPLWKNQQQTIKRAPIPYSLPG